MQKISPLYVFQVVFPHYLHPPGAAGNTSGRKSSQMHNIQHKKGERKGKFYTVLFHGKGILFCWHFSLFDTHYHVLPIAKLCQLEKGIFTSLKLSWFICLFVLPHCHRLKPHCFRHCTNKTQKAGSCLKGCTILWMDIGRWKNIKKQWHNKNERQQLQHICSARCSVFFFWWQEKIRKFQVRATEHSWNMTRRWHYGCLWERFGPMW